MSSTATSDQSIEATVAAAQGEAVAFLQALIQRPTENPPGETAEAMEWVAATLEMRGWEVERHPVPNPFARHYGRSEITNVVVRRTFGSGAGPTIALAAPLDTLPVGTGWHRDPFGAEIKDGLVHGRGARDSKADLAAYVFALAALDGREGLSGTVELHITCDEETGGFLGPAFLLGQDLTKPDAVIAAGTGYQVITGQEGVLHLEVLLRGVQAHASRPHDGHDALQAAVPILSMLMRTRASLPHPLTVGLIEGGRGINVVPDRVRFTVDRRIGSHEEADAVEAELIAAIEAAHTVHGVELECRRLLLAEPVAPTAPSQALAETLARHAGAAMGQQVPVVSAPVVSGARHYALAGIATVLYGVGPPIVGEGVDFTGDESVSIDDLGKATAAVAATLEEMLSR
ncbi:M20/M25/M40 family metallo-hydrolase [Acuticoccus sp. I52.16.1]|uniref:M20/M25/M40 family metallo-hydrolase n=1 Tax=Acuticoccus sp. I52.16.1 TaxID=2928472 RepID=UPI001FD5B225|nr:M20/M25/M40 family metallo-hydrolase [Acuticoccus sp. I52.16.1]UOM34571.1 M20/M25/M40 family metallo-hydrolase [Acuticoccus sp. I52.16.1]